MNEVVRRRRAALRLAGGDPEGELRRGVGGGWRPAGASAGGVSTRTVRLLVDLGLMAWDGGDRAHLTEAGRAHARLLAAEARIGRGQ